jgi:hypothetical protein
MTDLSSRLQELAEGAARQMRPPGADLARRRGRQRRRRLVAGVALAAALLVVGVVRVGQLADRSAPAPPVSPSPGPGPDVQSSPQPRQLTPEVDVGHGQTAHGVTWRLRALQTQSTDGKRAVVARLTVSVPGQPDSGAQERFEEPVRLGVDARLAEGFPPDLPVRPVYGAVSRQTARVVVIPEQGQFAVLSPVPAKLVDGGPRLPAKFWIAFLSPGPPGQSVHQVRTYDANGRELCRLDGDSITPRCTG